MARRGRKPVYSEARMMAVAKLKSDYYTLKNRIKNVVNRYGETPATKQFYEKELDKLSVKDLDLDKIVELQKQVNYIAGLKTSRVKNIENYQKFILPLVEEGEGLYDRDRKAYDKIMYVYERMVLDKEVIEKFRYELLPVIANMTMSGFSRKQIMERIQEISTQIYEGNELGLGVEDYDFSFGGKVPTGRQIRFKR